MYAEGNSGTAMIEAPLPPLAPALLLVPPLPALPDPPPPLPQPKTANKTANPRAFDPKGDIGTMYQPSNDVKKSGAAFSRFLVNAGCGLTSKQCLRSSRSVFSDLASSSETALEGTRRQREAIA
jgi:hypothetical protein